MRRGGEGLHIWRAINWPDLVSAGPISINREGKGKGIKGAQRGREGQGGTELTEGCEIAVVSPIVSTNGLSSPSC